MKKTIKKIILKIPMIKRYVNYEKSKSKYFIRQINEYNKKIDIFNGEIKNKTNDLDRCNKKLKNYRKTNEWVPPGHFYSVLPDKNAIMENQDRIFSLFKYENNPSVDLCIEKQIELINKFKNYYIEFPFQGYKKEGCRYFFPNNFFGLRDSLLYFCIIRYFNPKKIIEIGSGFSSAIALDTNELFYNNKIQLTFIEPFPERLYSLLKPEDKKVKVIKDYLQNIDKNIFQELESGDILFIDSSHVSKIDSDVNHIIFEILPKLKKGVLIHFHDIYYPFEIIKSWFLEGRRWNESYLLHAFLQYNETFKIIFWNSYMGNYYKLKLHEILPQFAKDAVVGGSIWLSKVN